MTQYPVLANTNAGWVPYTVTLSRDVTLFQLEFYDLKKDEWLDEWKDTNSLPKLVKIALGLGKSSHGGGPYDLVTSLVALPSEGVPGDLQGVGAIVRTNAIGTGTKLQ